MADEGKTTTDSTISEKHPSVMDTATSDEDLNKVPLNEAIPPSDRDTMVDPRLKDYPIPLVAKTVSLDNDPTEPILTFRFWFLSTFWIVIGCGVSTFYYFKPYSASFSVYAIQLLSWGMGRAMAKYLPKRQFKLFGWKFSLNPGPWNRKEHALLIVAYWGSTICAAGLGPLSALELYYGKSINPAWAILFLLTSQMIGYGFCGIFRDILVRPPKFYYPGELPNVALFNAMHKDPATTKRSLRFFGIVAVCAFIYEWIPQVIMPLLQALPLICYFGAGHWKPYVLGSGRAEVGFGILDFSFDWNIITTASPLFTPLWTNMTIAVGVLFSCWLVYPILYFNNIMDAFKFPPMSIRTWDDNGHKFNISRVMTPDFTLNQAAMDDYSLPFWSPTFAIHYFWGFATLAGSWVYAVLWHGKDAWRAVKATFRGQRQDYDDPYLKVMSFDPRVPHWWYLILLAVCAALSLATIYQTDIGLPWWGFLIVCLMAFVFTWPSGIFFGRGNVQVGVAILCELLSGGLFPGKPAAVLASYTYGAVILEQNLNLISDYKFGFYMKIPEREMFVSQVWGTLLGPFVNYGVMRYILDRKGDVLANGTDPTKWLAVDTTSKYSLSVIWGILGPRVFFSSGSMYHWVYYGFLLGAVTTFLVWAIDKRLTNWELEEYVNVTVFFMGAGGYPGSPTVNFMTGTLVALFFMGYMYRYHPVWFRKYNYLLGVGLDCGTQILTLLKIFILDLPGFEFPVWWGNNPKAPDRCFPPANGPKALRAAAESS